MSMDLSQLLGNLGPQFASLLSPGQTQAGVNTPGQLNPGDAQTLLSGPNAQSMNQQTPGYAPFGMDPATGAPIAPFGLNAYGVPFTGAAAGATGDAAIRQNAVNIPGQALGQWGGTQVGGVPTAGSPQGQMDIGNLLSSIFGTNAGGGIAMPTSMMQSLNPANNPQTAGQSAPLGLMGILQSLFAPQMPTAALHDVMAPQPGYQSVNQPGSMDLTSLLGNLFGGGGGAAQTQGTGRSTMPMQQRTVDPASTNTGVSTGLPLVQSTPFGQQQTPNPSSVGGNWGQAYSPGSQSY